MSFGYQKRRPLTEEEKSSDVAKARAGHWKRWPRRKSPPASCMSGSAARFTEQAAAEVVAEMVQREYVNDERYAEARAHSLLAARKSRRAAARNLRQKGLSAQQVAAALEAVYAPDEEGENPELSAAVALVEEPLPPEACHGPARLGRGGPAAARFCVCGRERSHQESRRRITPN